VFLSPKIAPDLRHYWRKAICGWGLAGSQLPVASIQLPEETVDRELVSSELINYASQQVFKELFSKGSAAKPRLLRPRATLAQSGARFALTRGYKSPRILECC
jgi:hypothetical protein